MEMVTEGSAVMMPKEKDVKVEEALARPAMQSGAALEPGGARVACG